MEIDWIHRPGVDEGTLNMCFNALDRHVVRGLADELALRVDRLAGGSSEHTYARLLEEVAAFGGVLRACGAGPGVRVLSRLPMGLHGLVAALATTRLGAVHVLVDPYADPLPPLATHRPSVVLADGTDALLVDALGAAEVVPPAVIWQGSLPEGQDLQWEALQQVGRADPAPVAEVPESADAFVLGDRNLTVGQVLEDDGTDWPLDALVSLVDGAMVVLSSP